MIFNIQKIPVDEKYLNILVCANELPYVITVIDFLLCSSLFENNKTPILRMSDTSKDRVEGCLKILTLIASGYGVLVFPAKLKFIYNL